MKNKIYYISASRLKGFRRCPYSTISEYRTSPEANFGAAVHDAIASMFKGGDPLAVYEENKKRFQIPDDKDLDARDCIENAERFLEHLDKDNIITVESADGETELHDKKFFQVKMGENWGFRGAMDIVLIDNQGCLRIIDWKTGKSREEDDLQLAIYALTARKKYGFKGLIKTDFVYLAQGGAVQQSEWGPTELSNAYFYIEDLVQSYIDCMENETYPKRCNNYCGFCSFKDMCDVFKESVKIKGDWDIEVIPDNISRIYEAFVDATASVKSGSLLVDKLKGDCLKLLEDEGGQLKREGRLFSIKKKGTSHQEYDVKILLDGFREIFGIDEEGLMKLFAYNAGAGTKYRKLLDKDSKKIFDSLIKSARKTHNTYDAIQVSLTGGTEDE